MHAATNSCYLFGIQYLERLLETYMLLHVLQANRNLIHQVEYLSSSMNSLHIAVATIDASWRPLINYSGKLD